MLNVPVAVFPAPTTPAVGQHGGDQPVRVQRQPDAFDRVAVVVERWVGSQHQPQRHARGRGDQHRAAPQAIDRLQVLGRGVGIGEHLAQ